MVLSQVKALFSHSTASLVRFFKETLILWNKATRSKEEVLVTVVKKRHNQFKWDMNTTFSMLPSSRLANTDCSTISAADIGVFLMNPHSTKEINRNNHYLDHKIYIQNSILLLKFATSVLVWAHPFETQKISVPSSSSYTQVIKHIQ